MQVKIEVDLSPGTTASLRKLLDLAFEGDFSEEDWEHALGGVHFIGFLGETIIAHGAIVPRSMAINGERVTVGYVEAIAVLPMHWHKGYGTLLMEQITQFCLLNYELSMLSTDEQTFYLQLGWHQFLGESFVNNANIEERSEEEDAGLMFLNSKEFEGREIQRVVCDSRVGDSW